MLTLVEPLSEETSASAVKLPEIHEGRVSYIRDLYLTNLAFEFVGSTPNALIAGMRRLIHSLGWTAGWEEDDRLKVAAKEILAAYHDGRRDALDTARTRLFALYGMEVPNLPARFQGTRHLEVVQPPPVYSGYTPVRIFPPIPKEDPLTPNLKIFSSKVEHDEQPSEDSEETLRPSFRLIKGGTPGPTPSGEEFIGPLVYLEQKIANGEISVRFKDSKVPTFKLYRGGVGRRSEMPTSVTKIFNTLAHLNWVSEEAKLAVEKAVANLSRRRERISAQTIVAEINRMEAEGM